MTITAIRPVPSGDPERDARIRRPERRAYWAARLRRALADVNELAAELHAAAPNLALDVAARVESNLFLARSAHTDLAADLDTGDLWQTHEDTADIEAYRYDRDLVDRTDPLYALTGSQIADRERAAFEAGRLAANTQI
jgi:hypothetical protein